MNFLYDKITVMSSFLILCSILFHYLIFIILYFQIEGTFQLNTPRHLLGYERLVSNSESSHYRNSTFLSLFIMAQPPLHPPEPIKVSKNMKCFKLKIVFIILYIILFIYFNIINICYIIIVL